MCTKCGNNHCGGCQPKIPQSAPGKDGKTIYNFTTASFTMPESSPASPDTNSEVEIFVLNTGQFSNQFYAVGMDVFIENAGVFRVVGKAGGNKIIVNNLGYPGNVPQGTTIPSNSSVVPIGFRGEKGDDGGENEQGFFSNLYSDLSDSSTATLAKTMLKSFSVPVGVLSKSGDSVVIYSTASRVKSPDPGTIYFFSSFNISIEVNNVAVYPGSLLYTGVIPFVSEGNAIMEVRLFRDGDDKIISDYYCTGSGTPYSGNNQLIGKKIISGIDFDSQIDIKIFSTQIVSDSIICGKLIVDKYLKQ